MALDTNTVIYFFKGMGKVAENLLATPPREIAVPSIVVYELEVGAAKSGSIQRRRRQLEGFLDAVTLLPFGAEEARTAAVLRAELERQGHPLGPLDTLIAGTALHHGATLVTRNLREFRGRAALADAQLVRRPRRLSPKPHASSRSTVQ